MIDNKSPDVITLVPSNNLQPVSIQTVTDKPITSNSGYQMQPFNKHRNWNDGLCDCFSEPAICCCTFWCPFQPIAMLFERVVHLGSYWAIFCIIGSCYITYYITDIIGTAIMLAYPSLDGNNNGIFPNIILIINDILFWIVIIFIVTATCIVRKEIRSKYEIPEQCCGIGGTFSEDCCCSFWCTTCTICQILRHITGGKSKGAKGCSCTKDPEQGCC